jgi:hypothetical protein
MIKMLSIVSIPRLDSDITREGPARLPLSRVLKNKRQTVSHAARRFGTRSPPAADEQFQSQHTAGLWSDVPFFNILLELNHNSGGVSRRQHFREGANRACKHLHEYVKDR